MHHKLLRRATLIVLIPALACGPGGEEPTPAGNSTQAVVPSVAETLPNLWLFVKELDADIRGGTLVSREELIDRCRQFYTADRMAEIDSVVPGWSHMGSIAEQKTLWHVNEAMVALLQLEEYRSLPPNGQALLQWTVLLHDIAKEPADGRDHRHAFRSAALAGRIMPELGFPVTASYQSDFPTWFELTDTATRFDVDQNLEIVDNRQFPTILDEADRIFADPTRTAVVAIALHQSITTLAAWPVKAPMTDEQVAIHVDYEVRPVLAVLTLADSGGWNLFDPPTLRAMYDETRAVFRDLPPAHPDVIPLD